MSIKRIGTATAVTGLIAALGVTASAQWGLEEDQQQQPQQPQQQAEPQPAPAPAPRGLDEPAAIEGADIQEATPEQREQADVVVGVLNIQDVARAYERMQSVQRLVDRDEDRDGFWLDAGALDADPIDAEMIDTAREKAVAVADDDIDMVVAEHLQGEPDNVALVDVTRPTVERINERTQQYREQLEQAVGPERQPAQPQRQQPERQPLELPDAPDDGQDDQPQDDAPFTW